MLAQDRGRDVTAPAAQSGRPMTMPCPPIRPREPPRLSRLGARASPERADVHGAGPSGGGACEPLAGTGEVRPARGGRVR
jgi:hypothetical protein